MILIYAQQQLDEFCDHILQYETKISIDTEFVRRTTYFAKLSLIQIATSKQQAVIDLLPKLDLTKLKIILTSKKILKIFHAPREDLEILYNLFYQLPTNIFDTQTAAAVVGLGKSLSYSNLVFQICNVLVNKEQQQAAWLRRPLSHEMLKYAVGDVEYLLSIYQFLSAKIEEAEASTLYYNRLNQLLDKKNYTIDFASSWKKVKFSDFSKPFVYKMQIMAAFREQSAIELNIPRRHFVTDEELVQLCYALPDTPHALGRLGLRSRHIFKTKYTNQLLILCGKLQQAT